MGFVLSSYDLVCKIGYWSMVCVRCLANILKQGPSMGTLSPKTQIASYIRRILQQDAERRMEDATRKLEAASVLVFPLQRLTRSGFLFRHAGRRTGEGHACLPCITCVIGVRLFG